MGSGQLDPNICDQSYPTGTLTSYSFHSTIVKQIASSRLLSYIDPRPVESNRKLEQFVEMGNALQDARRKHGMLAEVLEAKGTSGMDMKWIRRLDEALDDVFDALESGENAVLSRRFIRLKAPETEGDASDDGEKASRKRGRPPLGPVNDLSRDPATIPGAIRLVLAGASVDLSMRDLSDGVRRLRPDTTDPSISAALHPMIKRREIARSGFHKNYRYQLIVKEPDSDKGPKDVEES